MGHGGKIFRSPDSGPSPDGTPFFSNPFIYAYTVFPVSLTRRMRYSRGMKAAMNPNPADRAAAQTLALAKSAGAEMADVVLFDSVDLSASCRMGRQESLERSESSAIGLRVWVGKKQAIVSASDLSAESLGMLAERAVAMARAASEDPYGSLADAVLLAKDWPELDLYDAHEPEMTALYAMALAAEGEALAVKGITNSDGGHAGYSRHRVTLATSHGFFGQYDISSASVSVAVIAGEGDGMEGDYDYASTRHYADLPDPASIGKTAAERTLKRLNPRKLNTKPLPLVFDPRVGKSLLGALSGAISGAAIARGTSFLKDMLGKPVFVPGVNVTDDPLRVRGLGSHPFDGEGVAVAKRDMVRDGVLQHWFLDTRSAARLGLETLGHASRGVASPPSPSYSNFYMQAGSVSPKDLVADIKEGVYVTETQGMGVNIVTGDYSQGAAGFLIENGEITVPVSEITIAGQMKDMFMRLTPADDLVFRYACNAPTFRIDGMMVAGS